MKLFKDVEANEWGKPGVWLMEFGNKVFDSSIEQLRCFEGLVPHSGFEKLNASKDVPIWHTALFELISFYLSATSSYLQGEMKQEQRSEIMNMLEVLMFNQFVRWSYGDDLPSDKAEELADDYRRRLYQRYEDRRGLVLVQSAGGNKVPGSMIYHVSQKLCKLVGRDDDAVLTERCCSAIFDSLADLDRGGVFMTRAQTMASILTRV